MVSWRAPLCLKVPVNLSLYARLTARALQAKASGDHQSDNKRRHSGQKGARLPGRRAYEVDNSRLTQVMNVGRECEPEGAESDGHGNVPCRWPRCVVKSKVLMSYMCHEHHSTDDKGGQPPKNRI
jgi:hypothetical protein